LPLFEKRVLEQRVRKQNRGHQEAFGGAQLADDGGGPVLGVDGVVEATKVGDGRLAGEMRPQLRAAAEQTIKNCRPFF
jgi:hypothetical protein